MDNFTIILHFINEILELFNILNEHPTINRVFLEFLIYLKCNFMEKRRL